MRSTRTLYRYNKATSSRQVFLLLKPFIIEHTFIKKESYWSVMSFVDDRRTEAIYLGLLPQVLFVPKGGVSPEREIFQSPLPLSHSSGHLSTGTILQTGIPPHLAGLGTRLFTVFISSPPEDDARYCETTARITLIKNPWTKEELLYTTREYA